MPTPSTPNRLDGARHARRKACPNRAARTRRVLRAHRRAAHDPAVGGAARAGAAASRARPRMPAIWRYAEVRDAGAGGRPPDQRRRSRAPRADPREPGPARPVVHHAVAVRGPATDPARRGGARAPPHAVGAAPRAGRRRAPTPRWTASAPRCTGATSSSRRRGPGTTTATWATSRWSGSTGSTSRWCVSSTPASPRRASRRRSSRCDPRATRWRATARNMLPVDYAPQPAEPTRVFVYPYERSRARRCGASRSGSARRRTTAYKLRYVNPATGASPMPTIGAFAQWLPAGFETAAATARTDGAVLRVPRRRRRSEIGEAACALRPARCLRRAVVARAATAC